MSKLIIGIDISMNDFYACIKVRTDDNNIKIKGTRSFENSDQGFENFLTWSLKQKKDNDWSVRFVMEATGVYYENLAYYLHSQNQKVSVVLANKIKNYIKSLNVKTKTDKVDAKTIASFGVERELENWEPMSPMYKTLRDLCRELLSLKKEKQRAQSQLHALEKAHQKLKTVIKLKKEQIAFFEKAIDLVKKDIKATVKKDPALEDRISKLETIPGLGYETVVILVSETNGFTLFKNMRQVISYAGMDVTHNESGMFKGKTRISKRGNSRIRQALYMPALSACRANEHIKELYQRIHNRNPETKRKGIVAGMRKLLILSYILWVKDEEYNSQYRWSKSVKPNLQQRKTEPESSALDRHLSKNLYMPSLAQS
jgi:transposase